MKDKWEIGSIIASFNNLTVKEQAHTLNRLNQIKSTNVVDLEEKRSYYSEFDQVYTDLGEEELAIEELRFLTGRIDSGSIERLKYLTMWYDSRVKQGLYEGIDQNKWLW